MSNIKLKAETIINPMFNISLDHVSSKELPIPLMKQWRRIKKKLLEETKELQEDTKVVINQVFGDRFTKEEINAFFRGKAEDRDKILLGFGFSPEKLEDFKKSVESFDQKSKELGDQVIEIPFTKFVLPDSVTVREDCATILEDVIDLD